MNLIVDNGAAFTSPRLGCTLLFQGRDNYLSLLTKQALVGMWLFFTAADTRVKM